MYTSLVDTRDILNIFLILTLITVTVCLAFITFFVIQALKAVQNLADHLVDTTAGLRDKMGFKALGALPPILFALISKFIRRR